MDQTRSHAVEINEHAQPQRRYAPVNTGSQSNVHTAPQPEWMIAIQKFDGSSFLLSVPFDDPDSGEQVFVRVREQLSKVLHQKHHEWFMSMLVIKTVVGTAEVKTVMACNLDSHVRYRVSLQGHEHDPLLTEMFHGSTHLVGNDRDFRFDFTNIANYQGKRIMVVRSVLDKIKVARLLILLLLIAPMLGTVVAISTHGAEVAVAVSAGLGVTVSVAVFVLVSFLQALATWFVT